MAEKSANEEIYSNFLNGILSKIPDFDLKNYFHSIYQEKIPSYISGYLEPEKGYLDNLADEINPYINSIKKNLTDSLKNPKKAMQTSLEDLLFSSKEYKKAFCNKIKESVEEISYATEIAAVEAYKIWEVKYNLPIIGKIAREKLKETTGQEDLPHFDYTKKEINKFKEKIYGFLDYLGFSSDKDISQDHIRNKYQRRMKKFGHDERRLLEYDYNNGLHVPLNAEGNEIVFNREVEKDYIQNGENSSFEEYFSQRKEERKQEFIRSDYNSFWEKLICYLGDFFIKLFS